MTAVQKYTWDGLPVAPDEPHGAALMVRRPGAAGAIGLDYAIGLPEFTKRGLGPQLIWAYLRDLALPAHPAARQALAGPDVANYASIRALEKAGFQRARQVAVPGEPGPEQLCVLDVDKFFGEPGAAVP